MAILYRLFIASTSRNRLLDGIGKLIFVLMLALAKGSGLICVAEIGRKQSQHAQSRPVRS
jgi:hypothetical protein